MLRLLILISVVAVLVLSGCTSGQRNSALTAVRQMQSSGVAQAAEFNAPALPAPPAGGEQAAAPQQEPAPGAPATPPEGAAPADGAAPDAAAGEDAPQTPDDIIKDFVESDPRDILDSKSKDLKEKQTQPWNEEKPETFIPETGRKDPLTIVRDSVPKELLPSRSADDDESDLETYLFTLFATQAMQEVTQSLQCHSVIQIGIQKYAQMSFGGGRRGRFVISEGQGFNQVVPAGPIAVQVSLNISSISTKEVVVEVSVTPQGTAVTITKDLVFIPRM